MSFYHEKRKRTWADRLVLVVVVGIAAVVIALSAHSTFRLANSLGLEPFLTSGLVEIFFATLLLIRGRQRATRRKVPLFLDIGYYTSFLFVTAVNVWGLAQENPIVGGFVGIAISSAMLLAENLLVWLIVHGDEPYRKSARDLMKEARQEIQEEKIIQRIEWMKWEARKPDLSLIREARKAEERRKRVVGDGLPEYFLQEPDPVPQIEAEPVEIVQEPEKELEETAVVPMPVRQIGFHMEEPKPSSKPAPRFQPNIEARKQAIETAKALQEELGRLPKKRELMAKGISDHYSREALKALKNE